MRRGNLPTGRRRGWPTVVAAVAAMALVLAACDSALDEDAQQDDTDESTDDAATDESTDDAATDDDGGVVADGETFSWAAQSYTIAGTEPHEYVEEWADRVREMSGGRIDIDIQPGGAVVGYVEMREALSDGVLDLAINASGFFSGDEPAFAAFYNMPVLPQEDPELARYLARQWVNEWDGLELARELYGEFGIYPIGAIMVMNEPVHSVEPLRTLEDFEGKRIRSAPGLTGAMFEAVGAETVSMGGGDIYTALDTGVIDGAEFVGFTENFGLGLHEVTDYVQYPAFHSQVPIVDVSVSTETWESLPTDLQKILEDSVRWLDQKVDSAIQLRDYEILEQLQSEFGIEVNALSAEDQARVREIAIEETLAWRDQSEMSARIVDSMFEFLEFTGHFEE